jgi:CheY-like chemotaxis protein
MLPGVDGLEVLKQIRSTSGLEKTPVIVISNAYTPERVDSIWRAGVTQVMTKANSTPKDVARAVREALAGGAASAG